MDTKKNLISQLITKTKKEDNENNEDNKKIIYRYETENKIIKEARAIILLFGQKRIKKEKTYKNPDGHIKDFIHLISYINYVKNSNKNNKLTDLFIYGATEKETIIIKKAIKNHNNCAFIVDDKSDLRK
jgi:molybdopterin/thiamine biosynthesis adenylyltransferase